MSELRLLSDRLDPPTLDTAASTAILRRVAAREIGPTLRLFVPARAVAFGSQDRTRPGYADAVRAVEDLGFAAVDRLAGGRAAVFHEGTIAFAWATPHDDSKRGIETRFAALADIVVAALDDLGVTTAVGEVPGEYCPGRFSVHSEGRKIMGVGQRLVRGAAHVGGVVVVHSPEVVNKPLIPAYRSLGYDWNPEATGAVADSIEATVDMVMAALVEAFRASGRQPRPARWSPATLDLAAGLAAHHAPQIA